MCIFERLGLGEDGREFAVLEQQLLMCLREALSVGATGVGARTDAGGLLTGDGRS